MPYINRNARVVMDPLLEGLAQQITEPGDLNYVVSRLLSLCIVASHDTPGYHSLSQWRAALTDAAEEFYRRVMAPYEDYKRRRNGDVYQEVLDATTHPQLH